MPPITLVELTLVVNTFLPYFTLPYHTGKAFYRLALRPLMGPMRIPELTVRLQNPQVQYTPGSIPIRGTIPLPSEGLLTWTYLLTRTLRISKRISSKAHKHIHPGNHDQQDSKPKKSRKPISESSITPQKNLPSATLTWVQPKIGITST